MKNKSHFQSKIFKIIFKNKLNNLTKMYWSFCIITRVLYTVNIACLMLRLDPRSLFRSPSLNHHVFTNAVVDISRISYRTICLVKSAVEPECSWPSSKTHSWTAWYLGVYSAVWLTSLLTLQTPLASLSVEPLIECCPASQTENNPIWLDLSLISHRWMPVGLGSGPLLEAVYLVWPWLGMWCHYCWLYVWQKHMTLKTTWDYEIIYFQFISCHN